MRDPARIPIILKKIEEVWSKSPDLRLGQLLVVVTGRNDPFYVEDDRLADFLHHWQKRQEKLPMATQDVPGANPANADRLAAGCWGEHADGSLVYVKGTENDQIVYEIFDVAQKPVVYYQDAMRKDEFEKAFSLPPTGTAADQWQWHDKTPFPWNRVMKFVDKPVPQHADVAETLTAAARVAQSLRLRAQRLKPETIEPAVEREAPKGRAIIDRLQRALDALLE